MSTRRFLTVAVPAVAGLTMLALTRPPPPPRAAAARGASLRVDAAESEPTRLFAFGRCGIKRWAVKTLTDPAARSVDLVARRATVAGIGAPPAPELPADNTTRLPSERQAFRIAATLVAYQLEPDEDIHLLLAGGGKTMLAEIPSPNCDAGARARHAMLVVRRRLEARYGPADDQWRYVNQRVTVTGVRFFDFLHHQDGVADNGVELHPVFGLTFEH
jgi:hypothetical protein